MENNKYSKDDLAVIYKNLVPALLTYGYSITKNHALVEDSVHDLFLIILEMKDLSHIKDPKSYMMRSLKNLISKKIAEMPTVSYEEALHDFQHEPPEEDKITDAERISEMRLNIKNALKQLSPQQQEVIRLYYLMQKNYEEISEITGLKYKTVMDIRSQAIAKLKKKLGRGK